MGIGMSTLVRGLAALAALAAAPAFAQETPYEPTGEVRFHAGGLGSGASFSADRVVGPSVNMTRREDGGWAGDLRGHDLDLRATDTRLMGPNVNLLFSQKGDRVEVEGLFFNQRIRVKLDARKLEGRFGACSMDMARSKEGSTFRGDVGCLRAGMPASGKGAIQLLGEAAGSKPPLPQLALALTAVLPG